MRVLRRWLDRQHAAEIADMEEAIAFYKDWVDEQRADCNDLVDQVYALDRRNGRLNAYLSDIGNAWDLDEAKQFAAEALAEEAAVVDALLAGPAGSTADSAW